MSAVAGVWCVAASVIGMVALSAAACDGESGAGRAGAGVTVRDSAGVTIVENGPVHPRDMAAWRVDTMAALVIGAPNDTAYQFNRIGSIQQLPNGMILVMDGRGETAFQFRFYDSAGKHVATHGRPGQGPGEHRWINFVGSAGGDTVVGVDFPNRRLSWVSASAGYLRSARLDEMPFKRLLGDSASGMLETMVPLGDSLYAVTAFHDRVDPGGQFERGTSHHIVDLARETVFNLAHYSDPPMKPVQLSGRRTSVRPLGAGEPVRVVDRDRRRACSAHTAKPEIVCVAADGERTIIRYAVERVPYTDDDYQQFAESFRKSVGARRGMTAQDAEAWLSAMGRPDRHTAFMMLQLDTGGNLWIKEYALDDARRRYTRFRVLDPNGRQIAFADSFPTPRLGFGYGIHLGTSSMLRVVRDSDDVPSVAKFAIRKPD